MFCGRTFTWLKSSREAESLVLSISTNTCEAFVASIIPTTAGAIPPP
jgi:hypothetical protein